MNADEQIGLYAAGFFYPCGQWHEEVSVTRHEGAHGAATNAGVVDALAQQVCDFQHHVFFAQAAGARGARVLATMAGVQCHDDDAVGLA